jgi:hypothetical protein
MEKWRNKGRRREPRLADLNVPLAPVPEQVFGEAGVGAIPVGVPAAGTASPDAQESESSRLLIAGLYEDPRRVADLKVAAILDEFSPHCLSPECRVVTFRPDNWEPILRREKPHFLLVESAWKGNGGSWEYRVAKYDYPGHEELARLVAWCRANGIPTAFWNKEDPVHFERFIETAKLLDHVFTTDANCISRYRKELGHSRVYALPFAAQPRLHNPIRVPGYRGKPVCFAGSYYRNRHPQRRGELEWLLDAAMPLGLEIYDRGHGQRGPGAENFAFPERFGPAIIGGVAYRDIVNVYKQYRVFLNVNSVTDSPTMFSRRVFELLACGTVVVSTPAMGIRELLGDTVVQIVSSQEQASNTLTRLLADDGMRERLGLAGQRLVGNSHTYAHRLAEVAQRLGLRVAVGPSPRVSVIAWGADVAAVERAVNAIARQRGNADVVLVCATGDRNRAGQLLEQAGLASRAIVVPDESPLEGNRWWKQSLAEATGEFIAVLCPDDHYGPWYLADLARALEYSGADVVGKAAHFAATGTGSGYAMVGAEQEYSFVESVLPAAMVGRREFVAALDWPGSGLHDTGALAPWTASGARVFGTDRFNYLRGGQGGAEGVDL